MPAPLDLNLARVFVAVVEARGFTAAARALGLPKSSVSRSVGRLEEALGVRLLERSTRQLHLTTAGRAYHERAARALAELADAERDVAELQGCPTGLVRLTAPVDFNDERLASLLLRFRRQYPAIRVEAGFTNRRVDLVAEGYDVALRIGRLEDSSLVARRLGESIGWLVASPSYLERRRPPRRPGDLARHDCVLFRPRDEAATWTLTGPHGLETVEVRGPLSTDDVAFVHQLVLAGGGVGFVPAQIAAEEVRAGRLLRVLPAYELRGATVNVVVASRRIPRRVELLRDFLVAELQPVFS